MKMFLVLFSFFFLTTALNDRCLTEVAEELQKTTEVVHTDHESHSSECESCYCSIFCSYIILNDTVLVALKTPSALEKALRFLPPPLNKEVSTSLTIFHPPIS